MKTINEQIIKEGFDALSDAFYKLDEYISNRKICFMSHMMLDSFSKLCYVDTVDGFLDVNFEKKEDFDLYIELDGKSNSFFNSKLEFYFMNKDDFIDVDFSLKTYSYSGFEPSVITLKNNENEFSLRKEFVSYPNQENIPFIFNNIYKELKTCLSRKN